MAKPFDVATKHLIQHNPADWLKLAGLLDCEVEIVDTDLSTISAASDKLMRVKGKRPWLAHFELQSTYEWDMFDRFHMYTAIEYWNLRLPVHLFVILLRPEADGPNATGELRRFLPNGNCYEHFRYSIIRLWETPVDDILNGGLGTLPLAPLCNVTVEELPEVIRRMDQRLQAETTQDEAQDYWTASYLLLGLRYTEPFIQKLLQGKWNMKESVTYQAILDEGRVEGRLEGRVEGRVEEARNTIFRLGGLRFGTPLDATVDRINGIHNLSTLEALQDRLLAVETWTELLAGL